MAQGDALLEAGIIKRAGAYTPGWYSNITIKTGTTTNAGDSILITGADGTALSAQNPGHVTLPSTVTAGLLVTFVVSADVTILLTGCHWGQGTKGDLTDYMLSVYAINDAGTLKWGVASVPNHEIILNADDSATQTSISSVEKVLVSSALGADSTCLEIGWFRAAFDDTGGAAEDLWLVQTGLGDIKLGKRPSIWQLFVPTGTWSTNTTYTGFWRRVDEQLHVINKLALAGAPTTATLTVNLPVGLVLLTTRIFGDAGNESFNAGLCSVTDEGTANYTGIVKTDMDANTTVQPMTKDDAAAAVSPELISQAAPFTFASTDVITLQYSVPIVGWGA